MNEVYKIRYTSDDYEVIGYVAAPSDYLERKYPVLIYNSGGNRELGKLTPNLMGIYAEAGFVVLASQHRGVDGGTGKEQFGGEGINDIIKLIDISEQFGFVQQGGVYMVGHSRGGMMTYIICRSEPRIKAAAVLAGISDTVENYKDRELGMKQLYVHMLGGTPEQVPEEFERRSATQRAEEIDVPMPLIHGGESDWRVRTDQTTRMAELFEEYGKEFKCIIYEEADHNLDGTAYMSEIVDWFMQYPITTL